MRVLVTTDTVGGVWTYTEMLVRGLVERGEECLVAMIGGPSDERAERLPPSVEREAAPYRLEWLPDTSAADIRDASDWLRELARRWGADVVHLNQLAYSADPFDVPALVVAHSDVFSWFREVRDADPGPEWDAYRRWVRDGLGGCDCIVAPTCYQSGMLARHYGRAADRVIHNGVPRTAASGRRRASERPFVSTAGRAWDEAKGMAVLDEALERLGERAPPGQLAGPLEGPAGERFTASRLNAHGRLSRDAMDRLYENTAVYVATSLYEPFGLSPLEAALHGCALVLSDIGSFRELWQDAAVFVAPGAAGPLASAIADLMEEPARLDALAAAARSRARQRYTDETMTEQYQALYRRLVAAREQRGKQSA